MEFIELEDGAFLRFAAELFLLFQGLAAAGDGAHDFLFHILFRIIEPD